MKVQLSVVGRVEPFHDVYVNLPAIPRVGDTVTLPGLEDSLSNVRHVSWFPQGDPDAGVAVEDPFVYVVLGSALPRIEEV